jgi:NADPH-dependent glutamate synthase beta subunit-like oxidoreductase
MRRREWLIGAGAAAASAAVPGVLTGVASAATPGAGTTERRGKGGAETVDVAIVGGGLAGLNAAMTLAGQGTKVLVLEGDTRAGGRVRTADDFPTTPTSAACRSARCTHGCATSRGA